jgi:hypothetical protein
MLTASGRIESSRVIYITQGGRTMAYTRKIRYCKACDSPLMWLRGMVNRHTGLNIKSKWGTCSNYECAGEAGWYWPAPEGKSRD